MLRLAPSLMGSPEEILFEKASLRATPTRLQVVDHVSGNQVEVWEMDLDKWMVHLMGGRVSSSIVR